MARSAATARFLLLAALIGGILGMHVLTGGDMTAGHGPVPTAGGAVASHHADAGMTDPVESALAPDHSGPGHDGMAGCVLFLVAGAVTALAMLLLRGRRRRSAVPGAGPAAAIADRMRRGPPGSRRPRLTLCVDRI